LLSLGKKDNDSRQYNDPSLNDIRWLVVWDDFILSVTWSLKVVYSF
jgi:hypothetical protein